MKRGPFTKFFPLEFGPKGAELAEVACALMAALSICFCGQREIAMFALSVSWTAIHVYVRHSQIRRCC
jgi:hypothetical protein